MFIEASALVAILLEEDGFEHPAETIDAGEDNLTSAIAIRETTATRQALLRPDAPDVRDIVHAYGDVGGIGPVPIGSDKGGFGARCIRPFWQGPASGGVDYKRLLRLRLRACAWPTAIVCRQ